MGTRLNLIGQRFGMLTVEEELREREDRYVLWRCRCDCGGEIAVNTKRLRRGSVTSCGCVPKKTAGNGPHAEQLEGRRFGKLTVLRRAENRNGRVCWLCQCDCGRLHTATAHELKAGKTISCGCRRKLEEVGVADIAGKRFGRLVALFPTRKRDRKGSVYWHCRCDCGKELDVTQDRLEFGNYRSCGCLKKELQQSIPDRLHRIDGTCVEWLEKRKHRSDNTSGFRGVYRTAKGGFKAMLGFKRQRFYLGTFGTFEEAVAARLEAEEKVHDGFVKAYYRWMERKAALPEEELPLLFEVRKSGGDLVVVTNMEG